jgi:2-polyprenyl-6-methoxyphenol hydroxylase-like FAD-dependent oxidoreductase
MARTVTDADVVIVGAGPTGLMLAAELRLAGVRALVLERRSQLREAPKANGFSGRSRSCCATGGCRLRLPLSAA